MKSQELAVRYLCSFPDTDTSRKIYTIFKILDIDTNDFLHDSPKLIDYSLLEDLLTVATSAEVARILWSDLGLEIPQARFQHWCDIALDTTKDFMVLRDIGGAVLDYNRYNGPNSKIIVPNEVVDILIKSPDPNARIVGAKILKETARDFHILWHTLRQMMASGCQFEPLAAISVLNDILHSSLCNKHVPEGLDFEEIDRVLSNLDTVSFHPTEREILDLARRKLHELKTL